MFARFLAPAACLLALAAVHPIARSQVTGGHANAQFVRSWDQNGDTGVSRTEYDDARVQRYAATDADNSGALSQDEYVKEYAERLDAVITQTTDAFESLAPDYLSDAYTVVDLLADINVTKDVRLTAGIYNVADEKYYLWPRVRFVNEGTTTSYGYVTGDGIGRYSEPGRNFRVSLAWQF